MNATSKKWIAKTNEWIAKSNRWVLRAGGVVTTIVALSVNPGPVSTGC